MRTIIEALELEDLEQATTLLIKLAGGPTERVTESQTEKLGSEKSSSEWQRSSRVAPPKSLPTS
jgi:hypothetical protein